MMRLAILTLAVLLLSAWTANATEIYQWTDEDGVVHFSDSRPESGDDVTTLRVHEMNPPDYDPAADPYSISSQAERTNAKWAELEKTKEERQEKRREEARKYRATLPSYDPYIYYSRTTFYPYPHHGIRPGHRPKLARQQHDALEELGLTGPPAYSINSGLHYARIQKSRYLPLVTPRPAPHPKLPAH